MGRTACRRFVLPTPDPGGASMTFAGHDRQAESSVANTIPFNNAAERALRGVALGRKSWPFAGSERWAQRAALMYTSQAWLAGVSARAGSAHGGFRPNWRTPVCLGEIRGERAAIALMLAGVLHHAWRFRKGRTYGLGCDAIWPRYGFS
jgi:Transposase IS66 family